MRKLFASVVGLTLSGLGATPAPAQSGADILLNSVKPTPGAAPVTEQKTLPDFNAISGMQLDDPFLLQFFAQWQTERNLPNDVNAWAMKILQKDFLGAAHLWSSISPRATGTFAVPARVAQVYLYWRLKLSQTFFDAWVAELANPALSESRASLGLEQVIAPGFDRWIVDNSITVSPEQAKTINSLDASRSLLYATLKAWVTLKKGTDAIAIVELLPPDHKLKIPLAQTAALALARKGDLPGAARILKRHLEPALTLSRDARGLSEHYLQIARLLYQAGVLDGAEQFYEKIPNGALEYLNAREELTWIRLRKNDIPKLRGELVTLSSKLFDDHFSPEVNLVRAISNLKLCYYDQVEKNIQDFVALNSKWARQTEEALKDPGANPPSEPDFFSQSAERAVVQRAKEKDRVHALAEESAAAVSPGTGPQKHWLTAEAKLAEEWETAKKIRATEFRRQWKNRQMALKEAIQKMKFVRVELLSQIRQLAKDTSAKTNNGVVETSVAKPTVSKVLRDENPDMTFPFDGVVWADELFRLRSLAQNRCLEAAK